LCFWGYKIFLNKFSLFSNPAFFGGYKRIRRHIMLTFLSVNGIRIDPSDEEIIKVGFALAGGKMSQEELLSWILKNQEI